MRRSVFGMKNPQKLYSPIDSEAIAAELDEDEDIEEAEQTEPIVETEGKFTYNVPKDSTHQDAGKKLTDLKFPYMSVRDDESALAYIAEQASSKVAKVAKAWTLRNIVNKILKGNGRAKAYQRTALLYNPDKTISFEELFDNMVNDFIRSGMNEQLAKTLARNACDAAIKEKAALDTPKTETAETPQA